MSAIVKFISSLVFLNLLDKVANNTALSKKKFNGLCGFIDSVSL
uniref:Uncharacterized protein n=1 Tax=viral metagenome TaxID=1070528 RepID=A0A6C0LI64_9ZZZZ